MSKPHKVSPRYDRRNQYIEDDVSIGINTFYKRPIKHPKNIFMSLCELVRPLVYGRVRCNLGPGDSEKRWRSGGDPHINLDAMLKKAALHDEEFWGMTNYTRVSVSVGPNEHPNHGAVFPPDAHVHMRCDVARACGVDMSALVQDTLSIACADENCWHATIDCGYTLGYMRWGYIYGAIPNLPMTWGMWCDWWDWATSKTREHHVRIVNWGNYLGPTMVRALPKNVFDDFDSLPWNKEYPQSAGCVVRMPSGGVYVQLSRDPEDVVNLVDRPDLEEHPIVANAVWLRQLLRAHSML